jgi:hypothetical protein
MGGPVKSLSVSAGDLPISSTTCALRDSTWRAMYAWQDGQGRQGSRWVTEVRGVLSVGACHASQYMGEYAFTHRAMIRPMYTDTDLELVGGGVVPHDAEVRPQGRGVHAPLGAVGRVEPQPVATGGHHPRHGEV